MNGETSTNCQSSTSSSSRPTNDESSTSNPSTQYSFPIILTKNSKRYRGNKKYVRSRIVQKNGQTETFPSHRLMKASKFMRDLSNTIVDIQWRWTLTITILVYSFTWVIFGWFWMLIEQANDDPSRPCVEGCVGFAGYFQLSVENQESIGFGERVVTENCPEGIFLINAQLIVGVAIKGAVVGLVYAKMIRPLHRDTQKRFSRNAVVCLRDGCLCLIIRVEDSTRSHFINTKLQAFLLETKYTSQGEKLQYCQHSLKLEPIGFLIWPLDVIHRIAPDSPLYNVSAKDLLYKRFEIAVTLAGSSASTGQTTQIQTSYIPSEILWGHRFKPCVRWSCKDGSYIVEYSLFNETEVVDTPLCSAKVWDKVLKEVGKSHLAKKVLLISDL